MKKSVYIAASISIFAALAVIGVAVWFFAGTSSQKAAEKIGLQVDEIVIDLPGLEQEYELLFISDMHVLEVDDSIVADQVPVAQNRYDNTFRSGTGTHSPETWMTLSSIVDDWEADAVILGGDMMDFVSPDNVALFQKGLEQIKTPYMYVRADHDMGVWYSGGALSAQDAVDLHQEICDYEDVYVMDMGEFYIFGWNNSTSQLSEAGLKKAKEIWDDGKPIIIATHVPFNSAVDSSLADAAAAADHQGRKKLWGRDCLYYPHETTVTLMNMIYEENSPVKAVLSGHLHFKYTVQLTDNIVQYVFAPSFAGNMAHIVVK